MADFKESNEGAALFSQCAPHDAPEGGFSPFLIATRRSSTLIPSQLQMSDPLQGSTSFSYAGNGNLSACRTPTRTPGTATHRLKCGSCWTGRSSNRTENAQYATKSSQITTTSCRITKIPKEGEERGETIIPIRSKPAPYWCNSEKGSIRLDDWRPSSRFSINFRFAHHPSSNSAKPAISWKIH